MRLFGCWLFKPVQNWCWPTAVWPAIDMSGAPVVPGGTGNRETSDEPVDAHLCLGPDYLEVRLLGERQDIAAILGNEFASN